MSSTPQEELAADISLLSLPNVSSQQQISSLVLCAIQHILLAKGQVYEPIAVLQAKRAKEHVAEAQRKSALQENIMRPTGRSRLSIQNRRKLRKTDELLTALQQLEQFLSRAIIQLQKTIDDTEEVVLLLRLGQSRLSCRQQICIRLRGVQNLAAVEPPLQDVKAKRQKMGMMERKLIRFLLSLSAENKAFIELVNKPINLTRAHLFLLAPATFSCGGWMRYRAARKEDLESMNGDDLGKMSSGVAEKGDIEGDRDKEICDEVHLGKDFDEIRNHKDIDARRLQRMQIRAMKRAAVKETSGLPRREMARRKAKKSPMTANFSIDCNSMQPSQVSHKLENQDAHWFVCKTILKGVQ